MADFNEHYHISLLIAKKATGILSEEESLQLEKWRNTSLENEKLYQLTLDTTERNDREEYIKQVNTDLAWKKVHTHISPVKIGTLSKKIHLFWRIAAIVTITIGVTFLLLQKTGHDRILPLPLLSEIKTGEYKALLITEEGKEIKLQDTSVKKICISERLTIDNSGQMVNYHQTESSLVNAHEKNIYHRLIIPSGGEFQITLSDGTIVWLNSGTELKFPVAFTGNSREVFLKGEAYFSVQKDTIHPFIVNLENNINVEVLGTEFNINAYPGDLVFQTTLNKGAVKITTTKQSVRLTPDQQVNCSTTTGEMQLKSVIAANYSAWKDGLFIFENERLEIIMTRLSRWYNLNIFYQQTEVKNFHFTGDLEKYANFKTILRMIEKSTNVSFDVNGNSVTVKEIKRTY